MVTSESNRTQTSAPSPFERQAKTFTLPESEAPGPRGVAEPKSSGPIGAGEEHAAVRTRGSIWFTSTLAAAATVGSMWALCASVLAIIGLSFVAPEYMSPVAGIVLGLAFLVLAGIDTAWARMFQFAGQESHQDRQAFSVGVAAVSIAGLAGIILSILNLMFQAGARFGAVAVVVLGVGLLWHSNLMLRVSRSYHEAEGHRLGGPLSVNALSLAPIRDFLLGVGGVILGILAILNIAPMVLGLVALLTMGAGITFTTSTMCGATLARMAGCCSSTVDERISGLSKRTVS
jgi:hypothetical protein